MFAILVTVSPPPTSPIIATTKCATECAVSLVLTVTNGHVKSAAQRIPIAPSHTIAMTVCCSAWIPRSRVVVGAIHYARICRQDERTVAAPDLIVPAVWVFARSDVRVLWTANAARLASIWFVCERVDESFGGTIQDAYPNSHPN